MAWISEISYKGNGEVQDEFVEITLLEGENPADFWISFYDADGTLHTGASSYFPVRSDIQLSMITNQTGTTGSVTGGPGLDLQVIDHPDIPGARIFIIPVSISDPEASNSAEGIALTNSSGEVLSAYDVGGSNVSTFTEGLAAGATPTATGSPPGGDSVNYTNTGRYYEAAPNADTSILCFAEGTHIRTPYGHAPVETLKVHDKVCTLDGRMLPILFVAKREIKREEFEQNPKTRPIKVQAGALGDGFPSTDLTVSRQHRIAVKSRVCESMFAQNTVLVAAHFLTKVDGVSELVPECDLSFYHILVDPHALLLANGMPAETLFLGEQSLKSIDEKHHFELMAQFPQFCEPQDEANAAAYIPPGRKQKNLIERHLKNGIPFFTSNFIDKQGVEHPMLDLTG